MLRQHLDFERSRREVMEARYQELIERVAGLEMS